MNLTKSVSATGTIESAKTKNISADVNDNLTSAKEDAEKSLKKANKQLNEAMETYNDQKEKLAKKVSEAKKELNSIKSKVSAIKKKIAKEKNTQKKSALNVDEGDTYSGGTLATIEDAGSYTVTTSVDEYDIITTLLGYMNMRKMEQCPQIQMRM